MHQTRYQYDQKRVLITGAASGLGLAAAEAFQNAGAKLILADLNTETLQAMQARWGDEQVIHQRCDVSDKAQVDDLVQSAIHRFGGIDVLINSAGIAHPPRRFVNLEMAEWQRLFSVNVGGVANSMHAVLPVMSAQSTGGVILNLASVAGLVGAVGLSAYAASKHAVIGLTRSVAAECATEQIRINALCPSFSRTPMVDQLLDGHPEREGALTQNIPMKRLAEVDEVVNAILWLCSTQNSFMTGQAIALDGGLSAI